MDGGQRWAVTAGSTGVFFNAVDDHDVALPEWVETITARLPDGREVRPTRTDSGVLFDPQLPDGTVVLVEGQPFYTVETQPPEDQSGGDKA